MTHNQEPTMSPVQVVELDASTVAGLTRIAHHWIRTNPKRNRKTGATTILHECLVALEEDLEEGTVRAKNVPYLPRPVRGHHFGVRRRYLTVLARRLPHLTDAGICRAAVAMYLPRFLEWIGAAHEEAA